MPSSHSKHQRNFFPALVLTLVWWLLLALLVLKVDPTVVADFPIPGSFGLFFGLLFLAVGFLFSLLLVHSRRGFLIALGVVIFGYLRLAKLGSWLTGLMLAGLLAAIEFYLSSGRLTSPPGTSKTQANDQEDTS